MPKCSNKGVCAKSCIKNTEDKSTVLKKKILRIQYEVKEIQYNGLGLELQWDP